MTLTPEQIEDIEKRHARRPFETVGDYMKVLRENYYDIAALLADNKELREKNETLERACRMYQTQVAALSAAKPQAVDPTDVRAALEFPAGNQRKCPICAGWNVGAYGETPGVHIKNCRAEKFWNEVAALAPTQPSPDRLTREQTSHPTSIAGIKVIVDPTLSPNCFELRNVDGTGVRYDGHAIKAIVTPSPSPEQRGET